MNPYSILNDMHVHRFHASQNSAGIMRSGGENARKYRYAKLASNHHFTLLNNTTPATRIGTEAEQDTIADLTRIRSYLRAM